MDSTTVAAAGLGITLVLLLLFIRWRWRTSKEHCMEEECPPCQVQLVHRLCPHHNVIQSFEVEQKDSLDEHLDVLTRKLAEKEGRLRLSKSKIRETQNEIENLQAIDQDVRTRYREIMESLRSDLLTNEKECKKLQEQIEWVSRRRAELREEVRRGQRLYGEAAAELASNLAELQRGRAVIETRNPETRVPEPRYIETRNAEPRYPDARGPNARIAGCENHVKDCRYQEKNPDSRYFDTQDSRYQDCRYQETRYNDPRFTDARITDKPQLISQANSIRHRKEPQLPRATPINSLVIKTPPGSPDPGLSRNQFYQTKNKPDF